MAPLSVDAKGWLGIHLNQGSDWFTIATHLREAYVLRVPAALRRGRGETPAIEPPAHTVAPEEFDPLFRKAQQISRTAALMSLGCWRLTSGNARRAFHFCQPKQRATGSTGPLGDQN